MASRHWYVLKKAETLWLGFANARAQTTVPVREIHLRMLTITMPIHSTNTDPANTQISTNTETRTCSVSRLSTRSCCTSLTGMPPKHTGGSKSSSRKASRARIGRPLMRGSRIWSSSPSSMHHYVCSIAVLPHESLSAKNVDSDSDLMQ